jgi:nucleoside-diphosphate-sugar epimerase
VKILVTGATGFIGKNLVKRLVREENSVLCLVREKSDIRFLKNLEVELIYGDLLDASSLKKSIEEKNIDIIYHLAGLVYSNSVKKFYEVNIKGTRNLLEAFHPNKLKKFIYLSSIAVNGFSAQGKLIDETYPCNPVTPYGRSKLIAENLIRDFYSKTGVSVTIIRVPVVYGPDGQADLITKNFKKILKGRTFIVNNGVNLRSLSYVDNLIEGLVLAAINAKSTSDLYVIADDKTYSFIEIVNTIAEIYNVDLRLVSIPSFFSSLSKFSLLFCNFLGFYSWTLYFFATMNVDLGCDVKKAKNELGYRTKIDLKTGVKKTLDFYQSEVANSHVS